MQSIHSKMHNLVIVGAGQLGSRHLQSLAKMNIPVSIDIVDPNIDQLEAARRRFEEIPEHINIGVRYYKDVNDIGPVIDLCVVATTADVRSGIIKKILNARRIKSFILEKVLFQSHDDYDEIERLLLRNGVSAWVNCPRRMYSIYHKIKEYFHPGEKVSYHVNGGDWGLACNSIHFIDHAMFLAGMIDYEVDISGLDREIYQSKRKGFIEFAGTLRINGSNGSELILRSRKYSTLPTVISILGEKYHAVVFESSGKAYLSGIEGSQWSEIGFKVPYQSELTHLAVEEILSTGKCDLTDFRESVKLHKPMIEAFLIHLEMITGQRQKCCPIT